MGYRKRESSRQFRKPAPVTSGSPSLNAHLLLGADAVVVLVVVLQMAALRQLLGLPLGRRARELGERAELDLLQHGPLGANVHAAGVLDAVLVAVVVPKVPLRLLLLLPLATKPLAVRSRARVARHLPERAQHAHTREKG